MVIMRCYEMLNIYILHNIKVYEGSEYFIIGPRAKYIITRRADGYVYIDSW